ncbi:unnamed protein product [Pocillopora meandrina]|uniref:Multidrug resistance-associated protein 4 n=1 Tax=Pocillopora meandrina TaxID=46732 RepID=A0AAU9VMP5_9CNID|nr:unnamed protein product [Pocillopora meandrina]
MEDISGTNPIEKAGFFSLITFSWLNDVLKLGNKQPLDESLLFRVDTSNRTERLVTELEREWVAEKRATAHQRTKPRLWRAMMRTISRRDYIIMALLRLCYSLTLHALLLLIWYFLRSISTGTGISYKTSLPFVIGIFLVTMMRTVVQSKAMFKAHVLAIRLKVAVVGLIYKKVGRKDIVILIVILNSQRCTLEDSLSENTINLVSNDAQTIEELGYVLYSFSFAFVDLIASLALVWYLVAWQALLGISFFLVVVAYGSFIARETGKIRHRAAAVTDERLKIMNEIISGIRMVKMYAWEWKFRDLVAQIRRKEISLIRIRGFFISSIYALFFTSSTIAGFISVVTLLLTGNLLISFMAFTLLLVLSNTKMVVTIFLVHGLRYIADARTACCRMQRILENNSLSKMQIDHGDTILPFTDRRKRSNFVRIDSFKNGKPVLVGARKLEPLIDNHPPKVTLDKVSCAWSKTSEIPALQNVSLDVADGQLVGLTGPVGSGKTTLLLSILGELPVCSGRISCIGKMAFVSQIPWVYSGTVRENIVFGRQFVAEKYNKVIMVCDLEKDIKCFPKGDLTEIGQRGVILSGGQRARVSLARAIYTDADIYLLDDPLSAVDAKVGKNLFERCIKEFLGGRIRILATHQLQFLKKTDSVVVLENGSVVGQGTYSQVLQLSMGFRFFQREAKGAPSLEKDDLEMATVVCKDKSMTVPQIDGERVDLTDDAEDRMIGSVKWLLYWKYFRTALPTIMIASLSVFLTFVLVLWIAPFWWVSRMTEMPFEKQKNFITLLVYGSIAIASLLFTIVSSFCFYVTALRASGNLHDQMTNAVLKAPVLFFDTNPVGRILNRFSKDVGCMDDLLPGKFLFAVQLCLHFLGATILSAVSNVWLFITCTPLTVLFIYLTKYYLKSARELRRLEAITCSPVYSLIADTMAGLEVIRSSGMEDNFLQKFYRYQDKNTSALFLLKASTRWLAFRGNCLSNFLVTSVSAGALFATQNPALAGMSLTFAVDTLEAAQYGIQVASETENYMTSVERVFTYTQIESEPGYNLDSLPPESWPTKGTLTLRNLSLSYLKGAPPTLNRINLCISDKEKVGVAGRTGAGKSSLVTALFRTPEPEGEIIIDGIDITHLNIQAARRSMAVITQDPVLFSGSLRKNLDPFSLYKDHDLWRALEDVQLSCLVQQLPEKLEYKLKESGRNFSVGERQLICLARALLQKSKIIILDEATANVDFKTDRLIQDVIRNRFKDSTVITIAHRLNTIIDYDKMVVMDEGRVLEFDKPEVLLQNEDAIFARLFMIAGKINSLSYKDIEIPRSDKLDLRVLKFEVLSS